MKIPFIDLNAQHKELKKEIYQAIKRTIEKSDFILGKDVGLFENEFAELSNSRYAIGVSSGTAALFLALKSLDIGHDDEVIVPVFTYIATAFAVSYSGAKPVFVDIEKDTYNIDVNKIKKAVTKKTKAIIPVHLYGQPANMPEILKIAEEYNLKVIEDAAQAHNSSIKMADENWRVVGGISDITCFSFYPSKNLSAMGDGGIITTNDKDIREKLIILRDCGRTSKYNHVTIGYNSRLDTLQAAILRVKLTKLKIWTTMRQKAAEIYNQLLAGSEDIVTPYARPDVKHVYNVYAVRIKERDQIYQRLKNKGIGAIIHYPVPLHLQPAYKDLGYKKGDFPVAEKTAEEIISLPIYPHLKKIQIEYIVNTIRSKD